MSTGRSETGTSGGSLFVVARGLASYELGPADKLEQNAVPADERYWSRRSLRLAGCDVLVLTVYLPPGDAYI